MGWPLVEFKSPNTGNYKVYVRYDAVVAIEQTVKGSLLTLNGGRQIYVMELADEVVKKLWRESMQTRQGVPIQ